MGIDKKGIAVPLKDVIDDFTYKDDGYNVHVFWDICARGLLQNWARDLLNKKNPQKEPAQFFGIGDCVRVTEEDLKLIPNYAADFDDAYPRELVDDFKRKATDAISKGYAVYYEAW